MRVHVVNLPHTQTTRDYVWCAYTEKVRKFCDMLMAQGHEVILYAGEENEAACTEHVVVAPKAWQDQHFGHIDWNTSVFSQWDPLDPAWVEMNDAVIAAIEERKQEHDIIGLIAGRCQEQIQYAFPGMIVAEWGIGYEGVLRGTHKVYESHAWMHYVQGTMRDDNGHFFDVVIPNSFDPADFSFSESKGDYFLFLGRHTPRKGLAIVEEIAKDYKVITAGQGTERIPGAEYVGVVRGQEKAELIANARALLVPTTYLEPFGGVAVEAMMSGTPAITTDWGAFPETVQHGKTGFRCHSRREFLDACELVDGLSPRQIQIYALNRYSTDAVAPLYDAWLNRLGDLWGAGWYA